MEYETNSKKSFYNLLTTTYIAGYGNHKDLSVRAYPLSFLRSGYYNYDSGGLDSQRAYVLYWSLHGYNSGTYAYYLDFRSTLVTPQRGGARGSGFAVRCLAR